MTPGEILALNSINNRSTTSEVDLRSVDPSYAYLRIKEKLKRIPEGRVLKIINADRYTAEEAMNYAKRLGCFCISIEEKKDVCITTVVRPEK